MKEAKLPEPIHIRYLHEGIKCPGIAIGVRCVEGLAKAHSERQLFVGKIGGPTRTYTLRRQNESILGGSGKPEAALSARSNLAMIELKAECKERRR